VTDQTTTTAACPGDDEAGAAGVRLLRSVLDSAHEAFVAIDGDGLVTEWNLEAQRTFGFSREEMLGGELAAAIIPPRHRDAHRAGLRNYRPDVPGPMVGRRVEVSALHHEGHEFPIEMTISEASPPFGAEDRRSFQAFMHDISERKLSERILVAMQSMTRAMARAESPEQAMASLLETLGTTMGWQVGGYWHLAPDDALERMASWTAPGTQLDEFEALSGELRPTLDTTSLPSRVLEHGQPVWIEDFAAESRYSRAGAAEAVGLHAAIAVPVLRKADVVGVIECFAVEPRMSDRSITGAMAAVGAQVGELLSVLEERQALLTSLERLALTDQLTGLPNRRAWEEGLHRELARAARDGNPVCVAVIDLDYFKRFNDERGHQAGDALLAQAARAWQTQLRASDLLARYGGEEFSAVIPAWPLEVAVAIVERLRRATPEGLTASAGVACWNRSETPMELFGRADAALYEAKQRGRNRTIAAD
jgi:diguanylate cyclase (GGDEF)-like protein/PAS domain S-box-containing protein